MIKRFRLTTDTVIAVDYDGRRTTEDELFHMIEDEELRANNGFVFTDGKGFTTTVESISAPIVEILR